MPFQRSFIEKICIKITLFLFLVKFFILTVLLTNHKPLKNSEKLLQELCHQPSPALEAGLETWTNN